MVAILHLQEAGQLLKNAKSAKLMQCGELIKKALLFNSVSLNEVIFHNPNSLGAKGEESMPKLKGTRNHF